MPNYLLKLKNKYFEWSTVVDAPISYGMDREELHQYIKEKYGKEGIEQLPARLARLDVRGTSANIFWSTADLTKYNRAGDGETSLTEEEIYARYAHGPCAKCHGSGKVQGPMEEGSRPSWGEEDCPACSQQNNSGVDA